MRSIERGSHVCHQIRTSASPAAVDLSKGTSSNITSKEEFRFGFSINALHNHHDLSAAGRPGETTIYVSEHLILTAPSC
jgi:hypothetical protein